MNVPDNRQWQHIPQELRARPQWVVWRYDKGPGGKPTKVPYSPLDSSNTKASSTDPATWGTFSAAVRTAGIGEFEGIGFVVSEYDPFVGVDLDHCVDEAGDVAEWAQEIVERLDSYTEVTPSGSGLRVFVRGTWPGGGGRKKGDIEVYPSKRFLTVTGRLVPGCKATIEERSGELGELYEEVFGAAEEVENIPNPIPPMPSELSDEAIVRIASGAANRRKFQALWSGDISGYASRSEADLALCSILSFYTQDYDQLDRLMRQSGLGANRWPERADYRHRTINKALRGLTERYVPGGGPSLPLHLNGHDESGGIVDDRLRELLTKAPLTDAGNAECMAAVYRDEFRYCHTRGKWLRWDGTRWLLDADGEADRASLWVVRERQRAWLHVDDLERRKKALTYLFSSENAHKRRGMLQTAGILSEFATTVEEYDRDDWLAVAGSSGTLNLRTGELGPSVREDLITMRLGTHFDPEASAPRWDAFLKEVFGGDEELIAYVQRAVGYSLTGDTREQKMFLCHGSGANGKSVFLEVLGLVLGDYAGSAAFDTFDAGRRSEATNDLAALKGKRLVTVIETDEDRRLAEARVKAVTGQDAITCRFLYCEPFTYKPTFKLWMAMNHKPIIRGTDRGIWRRVKLVPFEQNFEGREDNLLATTLRSELSGILNWALDGLSAWLVSGLGTAQAVEAATEEYRRESDIFGQWLSDCAVTDPPQFLPAGEAYESFRNWCKAHGYKEPTDNSLGRSMVEKGFKKGKDRGKRGYFGIRLLPML